MILVIKALINSKKFAPNNRAKKALASPPKKHERNEDRVK